MTQPDRNGLNADQKRELLKRLLLDKMAAEKCFAMSAQQTGLWHAFRRDPSSTAYNVFLPSRIRSPLRRDFLLKSMRRLVSRHHSLRTTFSDQEGELRQTVQESLDPEVTFESATDWSIEQIRDAVHAETQRPFDLATGPLLRLAVWEIAKNDQVLVATTHHIITDFWSLVVLMEELGAIYPAISRGAEPTIGPPTNNYRNHVQQQAVLLKGNQCRQLRDYWRTQTKDVDPVLSLPTDFHRPAKFTHRGSTVPIALNASLSQRLRAFASDQSVTVNAVLLAGVQVLLSRCARQERFLIGSPFSGRRSREFESTVGLFSNVLPMRCEVSSDLDFVGLVKRTSATLIAAIDHESYPFASIVQDANPVRDISRSPLIQTLCTFENSQSSSDGNHASLLMPGSEDQADVDLGGLRQEAFAVPHPTCHYDVEFAFDSSAQQISGQLCYCVDLFERATVERMASLLVSQLTQLVQHPNVPLKRISVDQPSIVSGASSLVTEHLPEMLANSFHTHANHVAFGRGDDQVSFSELERQSSAIESDLVTAGVVQGRLVPVVAKSEPSVLPAIVAVLRLGGVVVPIDESQPSIEVDELLQQTRAKAWVHVTEGRPRVHAITDVADSRVHPGAAYVIYTSGSTGRPKGVVVGHDAIANTLHWRREVAGLRPDDRLLMLLSHQFDAGFGLILQSLSEGSSLIWPRAESARFDLDAIVDEMVHHQITVLTAGPSVLRMLASHPRFDQCRWVRQVWTGGEAMPSELPGKIRSRLNQPCQFWNFYGPTETAIEASAQLVDWGHDPRRPVSIGSPIHNTQIALVDSALSPVPIGVPGQLAVSGPGLADGYLDAPELTHAKFVTLPSDPPRRAYLTGDLGRLNDKGSIEFLGRMDQQVKLRGYRIELEEIDRYLVQQFGITDAASCVIGEGNKARLIAGAVGDVSTLDVKLPKFKRPDQVVLIDQVPRNASGKVDRFALAGLVSKRMREVPSEARVVPPENALESFLVDQWRESLDMSTISVNESFFDLGGSSLQAAMLTSKLSQELSVSVPTALLFDLADIRAMSRQLARIYPEQIESRFGVRYEEAPQSESGGIDPLISAFYTGGDHTPLFMIHPPGGIVVCYRDLANRLAPSQSLYAIRSRGLHGDEALPQTLSEMASDYVRAIETVVDGETLQVGGWSLGGLVAIEVAAQLRQRGHHLERLMLMDTTIPEGATPLVQNAESQQVGLEYGVDMSLAELSKLAPQDQLPFLYDHAKKLGVLDEDTPIELVQQTLQELQRLFHHHVSLADRYKLDRIETPITLFRPTEVPVQTVGPEDRGWSQLCSDVEVVHVPGHHHSMLSPPNVDSIAERILAL